ncbi:MAG: hypothetical protein CMJ95_10825 [Planctomycetes bacterium]|nr:hypothetical protein [Planctomycetota bacterium]
MEKLKIFGEDEAAEAGVTLLWKILQTLKMAIKLQNKNVLNTIRDFCAALLAGHWFHKEEEGTMASAFAMLNLMAEPLLRHFKVSYEWRTRCNLNTSHCMINEVLSSWYLELGGNVIWDEKSGCLQWSSSRDEAAKCTRTAKRKRRGNQGERCTGRAIRNEVWIQNAPTSSFFIQMSSGMPKNMWDAMLRNWNLQLGRNGHAWSVGGALFAISDRQLQCAYLIERGNKETHKETAGPCMEWMQLNTMMGKVIKYKNATRERCRVILFQPTPVSCWCKENVRLHSVQCPVCYHWIHRECIEKLDNEVDAESWKGEDCEMCKQVAL